MKHLKINEGMTISQIVVHEKCLVWYHIHVLWVSAEALYRMRLDFILDTFIATYFCHQFGCDVIMPLHIAV